MKKTKMTTKALSMFLAVIMLFTMVSVGIIVPETKVDANAAEVGDTISVSTISELNSAITKANTAGANKITTIKLENTITYSGSLANFTELTSANVVFDFAGNSLLLEYVVSGNYDDDQKQVQLPSANQGSFHNGVDVFTNGMFIIRAGSTMKIINSVAGNSPQMKVYTNFTDGRKNSTIDHQTSSSLIYNEGTLIVGDPDTTTNKNDFSLYAHSACLNTNGDNPNLYGKKSASANCYTVTVNSSSAIFKMYGGTVQATGAARSRRGTYADILCYALNINECYSSEIYGGSINIPKSPVDQNNGIFQASSKASEGGTSRITAIRCNSPYLYIFDVNSEVQSKTGSDSSNSNIQYTSNIWSTSDANAAHVYGGYFYCWVEKGSNDSTASNYGYISRGPYKTASGGTIVTSAVGGSEYGFINPGKSSSSSVDFNGYTVFIGDNNTASNGIDMFSYSSFRAYLTEYNTSLEIYAGNAVITTNGTSTTQVGSTNYIRNGYRHTGWQGKTSPGGTYNTSYTTPNAAGLDVNKQGGSLYLAPVWTETEYEIRHTANDTDGANKADLSGVPSKYTISSTKTLGTPTRPGYEFVNWTLTAHDYPATDDVSKRTPWTLNVYGANTSLNGMYGNIDITANWNALPYTATINLNGGNYYGSTDDITFAYNANKTFQFPQGLTRDYYNFDGYYEVTTPAGSWKADGTQYREGTWTSTGAYGDVTFTAHFTPIEYAVGYNTKNGTSIDDIEAYTYNYACNKVLPTTTRTGYTFAGWRPVYSVGSWDSNELYPAGFSFNKMHGDVEFEAEWETSTYTVTLELGEGEFILGATELKYKYSDSLALNNPTKEGYKFKGWVVKEAPDQSTDKKWIIGETYDVDLEDGYASLPANKIGNVTLVPYFEPITYTITFNSNGGSGVSAVEYTVEDVFQLPTASKNGYDFSYWSVASDREGTTWTGERYYAGQSLEKMRGNITLRAEWTDANYTITLDANGGDIGGVSSLNYSINADTALNTLNPKKTGYSFKGWKVVDFDANSSWEMDKIYTDAVPTGNYGNLTLEAQWEHTAYTVHFSTLGTPVQDVTYYIDSEPFKVLTSSNAGYEFLYWEVINCDTDAWTTGEKIYADTVIEGRHGNVTLDAKFRAIPYTLTFRDVDGRETVIDYDMRTSAVIPAYERAGYTFTGWKVESVTDGIGWAYDVRYQPNALVEAGTCYGNVVFVPDITVNEYEITFISDGGTPYVNAEYTVESTDVVLPTPEKEGFDFVGWKVTLADGSWTENDIIAGGTALSNAYGNVTLTAQWTAKKYDITWITGSGTYVTDGYHGEMPSYDGVNTDKAPDAQFTYTFTGWTPALQTVTGEKTYEAVYATTLNSYTVTWKYETDETSGIKTETNEYNYGVHPIFNNGINPVKTSLDDDAYVFRFVGWVDEQGNYLNESTVVTGNKVYTAEFRKVLAPRTVTWIINGVAQETKWEVGETPSYVGVPVKPDENGMKYTFSHWTPAITVVENDKDYEYEAVFTESAQTYTASFDLNGGSYDGSLSVSYTKTGELNMPKPVKTGYTFSGWRLVSDGGNWASGNLFTSSIYSGKWGNVSFVAEYKAVEYTINVEQDGSATTEYKYTIESTDTLPAIEKEGYVLAGWIVASAEGNWVAGDTVAADKLLTGMYGNVIIHPVWTARLYKITWISGDIVQEVEFKYGDTIVVYPPVATAGYTATWDRAVPTTMPNEDLVFNAVYSPIQYYLRFNVAGGSETANFYYDITSSQTLPTPTREGATFKGWKVSAGNGNWEKGKVYAEGTVVTGFYGNVTFTAQWEIEIHTVTWVAGDITRITKWYHGAIPSYDGVPYKSSDEYNSYVFLGWDKEIVTVTEDVTYTALFDATEREYVITWNVDNSIITEKYKFGETPVYPGETPTRASTTDYDFTFSGWSPEVDKVTGDITYYAQFDVFTKLLGLRVDKAAVFIDIEEEAVITAILSPSTATVKDVEWYSADESIATVDEMGKVTGVGAGNTLVRVQSKDGNFKSYAVICVAPIITEYVIISAGGVSTTRLPGEAIQLTATVMPENASNKTVTWSSSDTTIATVDENGLVVFGDVIGTAVITAVADGYAVGTIEVSTTEKENEIVDTVKTYMVMFMASTSTYIISGQTYEKINVIYPEGATVEFLLTEPHFATANGTKLERDIDGVFRIKNIDRNYTIMSTSRADIAIPDDDIIEDEEPEVKLSFFDKLKAFFRSIVEFFRNLF